MEEAGQGEDATN